MNKRFDAISLGELVVEFFRKEKDIPFDRPGDIVGPYRQYLLTQWPN
jgi:hypothetical protein